MSATPSISTTVGNNDESDITNEDSATQQQRVKRRRPPTVQEISSLIATYDPLTKKVKIFSSIRAAPQLPKDAKWDGMKKCVHIITVMRKIPDESVFNLKCSECDEKTDVGMCLVCGSVHCSREIKGHGLIHHRETGHCIHMSLQDFSVWCYACNSYLEQDFFPRLKPSFARLHAVKFGYFPPNLESQLRNRLMKKGHTINKNRVNNPATIAATSAAAAASNSQLMNQYNTSPNAAHVGSTENDYLSLSPIMPSKGSLTRQNSILNGIYNSRTGEFNEPSLIWPDNNKNGEGGKDSSMSGTDANQDADFWAVLNGQDNALAPMATSSLSFPLAATSSTSEGSFNDAANIASSILDVDEDNSADLSMFDFFPTPCSHVNNVCTLEEFSAVSSSILNRTCSTCNKKNDVWICLEKGCLDSKCGRSESDHMTQHRDATGHSICMLLDDLSIWCEKCSRYLSVNDPKLSPLFNHLHNIKFGYNAF